MVIFKEKASIVSEAFSILALVLSESFLASVGGVVKLDIQGRETTGIRRPRRSRMGMTASMK